MLSSLGQEDQTRRQDLVYSSCGVSGCKKERERDKLLSELAQSEARIYKAEELDPATDRSRKDD